MSSPVHQLDVYSSDGNIFKILKAIHSHLQLEEGRPLIPTQKKIALG